MTAFWQSYYTPTKFDIDQRNNSLGAACRSNLMTREQAIEEYKKPPHLENELLDYFIKRMGFTEQEFNEIMNRPKKTFRNYKTYKQRFERYRPLFYLLAKFNLVPMSFYIKYTSKGEL